MIICGNALTVLRAMKSESIDCIITSPPYWNLRDYGEETKVKWQDSWFGQLGEEPTIDLYLNHLLQITKELKRVLKKTGTFWLNMGSTYNSKDIFVITEEFYENKLDI